MQEEKTDSRKRSYIDNIGADNGLKPHCSKESGEIQNITADNHPEQGALAPCDLVPCDLDPFTSVPCENLQPFHITWVTHNSRVSERMIQYKVKRGEPFILDESQEIEITKYIFEIAKEKNINIIAYNICRDHVHILLYCEESQLNSVVCALKSKSTYLYKKNNNISESLSIWAQKYNCSYIESGDKFYACIEYIKNNRKKHNLPDNIILNDLIQNMVNESFLSKL